MDKGYVYYNMCYEFINLNIPWAPFPWRCSRETYVDIPGDRGDDFSRTQEEKPGNVHQVVMDEFTLYTHEDNNKIVSPVQQSREMLDSEWSSPGLLSSFVGATKLAWGFWQGLSILRM